MARPTARSSSLLRVAVPAALLACLVAAPLVGCESAANRRHRQIRGNLTPELRTLHQRPADIDNAVALTFDTNGRMFNQDWGRVWMTDRPSRLTPEPMPR